jgi:hypothetical protein
MVAIESGSSSLHINHEKVDNLLEEMGMSSCGAGKLKINVSEKYGGFGGWYVFLFGSSIRVSTSPEEPLKETRFVLLHEMKHAVDLQEWYVKLLNMAYYVVAFEALFEISRCLVRKISYDNLYNSILAAALALAILPLVHKISPIEMRANRFAKKMVNDPRYEDLIVDDEGFEPPTSSV